MAPATATRWTLSDDLLERCGQRAATYDRENRFFTEDFEELRRGRLPARGGAAGAWRAGSDAGRDLSRAAPARRAGPGDCRGAQHAHLATGVAADLYRRGDHALRWLLEDIVRGEVVGYGYSEPGNDIAVMYSAAIGRAGRGWLPIHGAEVLQQPDAGLDPPVHLRDGPVRTRARRRWSMRC